MHQSCATCLAVPGSSIGRLRTYVLVQVTEQSNPKLHRGLVVVARDCSAQRQLDLEAGAFTSHACMALAQRMHGYMHGPENVGPSAGADKITSGDYSIVLLLPPLPVRSTSTLLYYYTGRF